MRTYKYQFEHPSNVIRLGNLLDDMHEVHKYFHLWQRQRYKDGLPYANYHAMSGHLTELKKTTHRHWNSLPSQAIQCELKRINTAYQRFFNKLGGRPHIKRKDKFKSMTFPGESGWNIEGNRVSINLKKWNETTHKWQNHFVPYSFYKHREWDGNIRGLTIKRDNCGDYYLCITTDYMDTDILPTTGQSVGANFGMKGAFLTLNTGEKIQSPQFLKHSLNALRKLNKAVSRKVKGSNNWWHAVRELARLHRKICNQRLDWHWKLATYLCRKFDLIATETLNLDGMKCLWGRKVSDLAFGEFVEILKYKCVKHNRECRQVGQWTATTKPCSDCGYKNDTLSLSDRQWTCPLTPRPGHKRCYKHFEARLVRLCGADVRPSSEG